MAPLRLNRMVGMNHKRFNHSVQVEKVFLQGLPVYHMIDGGTYFSAATFLRTPSTAEIWKSIQNMCNLVYLGLPELLSVYQGTNYLSNEMKAKCESYEITVLKEPIETPGEHWRS